MTDEKKFNESYGKKNATTDEPDEGLDEARQNATTAEPVVEGEDEARQNATTAEPVVEGEDEGRRTDEGEGELEGTSSFGFSQPSHVVIDNIDNKLYLASRNIDVYPNVIGYGFDEMFKEYQKLLNYLK